MNILIFGGTGSVGAWTARKALERGHFVTLHVRDANRVPEDLKSSIGVTHIDSHALIIAKIYEGTLADETSLTSAIKGQDVILSSIGPNGPWGFKGELIAGYRLILRLMRTLNVHRIIAMTTISCYDPHDSFAFSRLLTYLLIFIFARIAQLEVLGIEKVFKEDGASIDWTLARVPVLKDSPEDGYIAEAGYVGDGHWNLFLERRDWANWMIREAERECPNWVRESPALYTPLETRHRSHPHRE
ncbi:hypothetical protein LOZ65_002463 [Ophidiomyces ophidiicola]|nr:hypothetical protein LOZ65_002463 [Ophidiomyces ophidiicola]